MHSEPSLRTGFGKPSRVGGTCGGMVLAWLVKQVSVGGTFVWGGLKEESKKEMKAKGACLFCWGLLVSVSWALHYPTLEYPSLEWVVSFWFWLLVLFATSLRMVLLQRLDWESPVATGGANSLG